MSANSYNSVFDYRALRLLMGLIAILIAPVVIIISSESLSSISASYYTNARDVFVGSLFIVGAFWWAYKGHMFKQTVISKVASIAVILVALFPTACATCGPSLASNIHIVAAITFFSILAYFCFGPFRLNTKGRGGKRGARSKIYFGCGCVIVGSMLVGLIAHLTMSNEAIDARNIIFWVELSALTAFGVAWLVAGKYFRILVDDDQAINLFSR